MRRLVARPGTPAKFRFRVASERCRRRPELARSALTGWPLTQRAYVISSRVRGRKNMPNTPACVFSFSLGPQTNEWRAGRQAEFMLQFSVAGHQPAFLPGWARQLVGYGS